MVQKLHSLEVRLFVVVLVLFDDYSTIYMETHQLLKGINYKLRIRTTNRHDDNYGNCDIPGTGILYNFTLTLYTFGLNSNLKLG